MALADMSHLPDAGAVTLQRGRSSLSTARCEASLLRPRHVLCSSRGPGETHRRTRPQTNPKQTKATWEAAGVHGKTDRQQRKLALLHLDQTLFSGACPSVPSWGRSHPARTPPPSPLQTPTRDPHDVLIGTRFGFCFLLFLQPHAGRHAYLTRRPAHIALDQIRFLAAGVITGWTTLLLGIWHDLR